MSWREQWDRDQQRQQHYNNRQYERNLKIHQAKTAIAAISSVGAAGYATYASLSKKPEGDQAGKRLRTETGYVTPSKQKAEEKGISPDLKHKMAHRVDRDEEMHEDNPHQVATIPPAPAARGSAVPSQSTGGMGQETRITPQRPHYGLPNTHTAVLPFTSYFSVVTGVTTGSLPTKFSIRLNTPYDTIISAYSTPVAGAGFGSGLYDKLVGTTTGVLWQATLLNFPSAPTTGSAESPQWRDWWDQMYAYYAVIGLEYEFTIVSPQRLVNNDVCIASYIDTFSTTNSTLVHPVSVSLHEMSYWPDVSFTKISGRTDGSTENTYRTIKGHYRPGQAHKNVENDEDVKTWTKVGSIPSLNENLTLCFGKGWNNDISTGTPLNVRMTLRWIVQFKDLSNQVRWPTVSQTPFSLTAPTDIISLT